MSAGQLAAKLQAVKVGYLKKSYRIVIVEPNAGGPGSSPGQSDHLQSLTDHNFAALGLN